MLRFIFLFTSLPFNMLLCIESVEFDWFTLIFSHQPPAEIFTNWLYFWNILKIGFDRCFCYFANISFSFFFFLNFWQLRFRFAKICIVRKYNKIQNVHVLKIVKISVSKIFNFLTPKYCHFFRRFKTFDCWFPGDGKVIGKTLWANNKSCDLW